MLDVVMILLIASWFYKTAYERRQNKAIWVLGGLGGYLTGELTIGWKVLSLLVGMNPALEYLQTVVIIAGGLLGMLLVRTILLTCWKETHQVSKL